MQLNVKVLLQYDMDRLLAPYLKAAGLQPKAQSFSNWDGLDGHIGGVPEGDALWNDISSGKEYKVWDYWVPWYNVHKMYAGLRDSWLYAGSDAGRTLFLNMCDWGIDVISALKDDQMESMLDNEFGGMNEVYADAYAMTKDDKYLAAAKRFTHHRLFDAMKNDIDNLDNFHANTQVAKAVGFQRIAELTGDVEFTEAARFFWETVTGNRSISIGGNSRREHFPSTSDCKSYIDDREGPESCNTYNMLKLTEGLFRMSPDARYADFYERALFNHILSSQHPVHGGYVYFTSARPGHYRVYSSPNSAMWCCVGTGMENHGKYGQFIYTHKEDSLWVNLFIPSVLDWKGKNLKITQSTRFPYEESTRFSITTDEPKKLTLLLRHPGWCQNVVVKINGKVFSEYSEPSSYIAINRNWNDGDVVELELPMKISLEELNHEPRYISILCGPMVMGTKLEHDTPLTDLIADDNRWSHIANGPLLSVFDTPLLIGQRDSILKALNHNRRQGHGASPFSICCNYKDSIKNIELQPFCTIHDCRYMLYWLSMTHQEYADCREQMSADENLRLALDSRTVDAVNTGEQQPEADHFMECNMSLAGNFNGESWRNSFNGGHFSYKMRTGGLKSLILQLRYWGNESGQRKFNIHVDDTLVASENLSGKYSIEHFVDEEYVLPTDLLENKEYITIKFTSLEGDNIAGAIYNVRLLHP